MAYPKKGRPRTGNSPRMLITVPVEIKKIFEDAAEAIGIPTARLVTQMMIGSSEVIKTMGETIIKAKASPLSVLSLSTMETLVDKYQSNVDEKQIDLEELIEREKVIQENK